MGQGEMQRAPGLVSQVSICAAMRSCFARGLLLARARHAPVRAGEVGSHATPHRDGVPVVLMVEHQQRGLGDAGVPRHVMAHLLTTTQTNNARAEGAGEALAAPRSHTRRALLPSVELHLSLRKPSVVDFKPPVGRKGEEGLTGSATEWAHAVSHRMTHSHEVAEAWGVDEGVEHSTSTLGGSNEAVRPSLAKAAQYVPCTQQTWAVREHSTAP